MGLQPLIPLQLLNVTERKMYVMPNVAKCAADRHPHLLFPPHAKESRRRQRRREQLHLHLSSLAGTSWRC